VIAVCGNPFLEFQIASTVFLTKPERHDEFLCQNPKEFQEKGVEYIFDVVEEIVPSEKKIRLAKGQEISYSAVIVATGNKLPLLTPVPGQSLQERRATVRQAGDAIKAAKTIVVNGAGAVGLEMAGDAKLVNPSARVVLLSRSGEVLASSHNEDWQRRVKAKVQELGVEVMKASVKDAEFAEHKLSSGSLPLVDGPQDSLDYDVYIPAYMQGPNTAFLAKVDGALNDGGQITVNNSLQSTVVPEVFGVGVSDTVVKQPYARSVTDHASHAVSSAIHFLENKPLKPFSNPGLERPMTVLLAHGKGGYMFLDTDQLPCPVKCCCCVPCGGGFPCCPPPCCWCHEGCSRMCGSCGTCGAESEGGAIIQANVGIFKFAESFGFAGMGKAPVQQEMK
jgi:NADPH-dependent 2,4-dienoyl-CoA reductase/sulfur reductase-like enzyme